MSDPPPEYPGATPLARRLCDRGRDTAGKICETCTYRHTFYLVVGSYSDADLRHECRIHPPQMGEIDGWPRIELEDWCQEWQPRQVADSEEPF